jgi:hypothetical protein
MMSTHHLFSYFCCLHHFNQQAAEANGCRSEGFDERTNCLIREFKDEPRYRKRLMFAFRHQFAGTNTQN